ncbi:glycogen/starch/alpha-glucan phosphorylase [Clostridium sp. P21]|uniref:Alpha-1,4 glucan phosphorylase n=1 Tax=Clostridium muellerianum TaxID=2716538 RepID=A0A7Y0EFR8_9CLOT|nr:glycogen/starch/alpha-glucan phosphorylase [Clostridium muellerianum]NMM62307.1 glycogen/starch/alpha-glucan phosphorylase [Clostridium muellerianum]
MYIDKKSIKRDFINELTTMYSEDIKGASNLHKYFALSELVKKYSSQNWMRTNRKYKNTKKKQVYYFSMEFLIGRLLGNNLLNLGIKDVCKQALKELGINLNELEEVESDAGLGNGGLGRLAACFLDSMASLGIPGHGCGIRYYYGLFEQKIINGYQVEVPDHWLRDGNIWETRKENKAVKIRFSGNVRTEIKNNSLKFIHENYEEILAVPYDTPVIGYNTDTVNTLRLWNAEVIDSDFDFDFFSKGDYSKAVEHKNSIESISQVLYPDDSKEEGKLLRLKQQYFFVSAGLQSIIRTYKKMNIPINELDKYIAVQINDTHPSVAVAELMRILIDEEEISWDEAFKITTNVMSYTNHTILSEALEKWPIYMFKKLLPRIYMIIEEINKRFCEEIKNKYPNDNKKLNDMSIIFNGEIRMAYLAIVGSHSVNGVAKLHTDLLKNKELKNFNEFYERKFNNKTNGITHRRWLLKANPSLTKILCETIGDQWIKNPLELEKFSKYADDLNIQNKVREVKEKNKISFCNYARRVYGIEINPYSIFDVQVKRLHAYKRQMLNVFNILNLYYKLKENPSLDIIPRTFFFGGKAAPGYYLAKQIIKFINTVASKINNDKDAIHGKLKVVFLPNYSVSLAEKIIPCADVSEQISTATKEASGTGNMKFMMNGAVTIATLDGANIEIKEAVGDKNIVIFGMNKEEVLNLEKNNSYKSNDYYYSDPRLKRIINSLIDTSLNVSSSEFKDIYSSLLEKNDEYFVLKDFDSYVNAQDNIDKLYRDKNKWQEMCIMNISKSGIFSSDNTIKKYAKDIWNV